MRTYEMKLNESKIWQKYVKMEKKIYPSFFFQFCKCKLFFIKKDDALPFYIIYCYFFYYHDTN